MPLLNQNMQDDILGVPRQVTVVAGEKPAGHVSGEITVGENASAKRVRDLQIIQVDSAAHGFQCDGEYG